MLGTGGWLEWVQDNQVVIWVLGGVSVASIVLAIVLLPVVIARMPAGHFQRGRHRQHRSAGAWALRIGKNVLGLVLVLVGVVLLLLPGQGLLMILAGVLLLEFPGKRALERWLIQRDGIKRFLDRMRARHGEPPFEL